NSTVAQTDLIVSKMDTNGVLIWTKGLGESGSDNNPGNIVYNGKRQIYVNTVPTVSSTTRSVILRLDSSGVILNSKTLVTNFYPRFEKNFSAVLNNKLVTIDRIITSTASTPGPFYIRELDTNLVAVNSRTIGLSFKVENVFSNNVNLLLSGPTPTTTALKGFRSIRFDTLLNTAGARHYNKINTVPPGGTSSSFINSSNNSMHFLNPVANDTVFVAKTDLFEAVNCRDSSYVPVPSTLNFVPGVVAYTTAVLTLTTTNITVPVASTTYTSTSTCTGLTTGISSISKNEFISLYPNPVSSTLFIHSENNSLTRFVINDVMGKEIISDLMQDNIDVSQLQAGIYFLLVYDQNNTLSGIKKFIKD
ncbi:MAG: T9SS type A sorting domain-containing protein, partial [Bacteroidia bacterium]